MSAKRENNWDHFQKTARLRRVAGGTHAVPANRLTGPVAAPLPESLLTVASFDYYDPFSHPGFVDWLLQKMAVKVCLEVAAVLSF